MLPRPLFQIRPPSPPHSPDAAAPRFARQCSACSTARRTRPILMLESPVVDLLLLLPPPPPWPPLVSPHPPSHFPPYSASDSTAGQERAFCRPHHLKRRKEEDDDGSDALGSSPAPQPFLSPLVSPLSKSLCCCSHLSKLTLFVQATLAPPSPSFPAPALPPLPIATPSLPATSTTRAATKALLLISLPV